MKTTKSEVRRWEKWLRSQGCTGPFQYLTTSHEHVKSLWKELKKDPPTILETQQRDRRTIVSAFNRFGSKKTGVKSSENEIDISLVRPEPTWVAPFAMRLRRTLQLEDPIRFYPVDLTNDVYYIDKGQGTEGCFSWDVTPEGDINIRFWQYQDDTYLENDELFEKFMNQKIYQEPNNY